ncbi:MAG: ethanolamine utilization protein EutH [Endomicrobium sp.]|jgi:ethanolamine transporter|nr:ethanolamine utilization protein EutH [Endomicrobium sp.]
MNLNDIIVYFMLALMCLAVLDYAFGGKFGLGQKYVNAFTAMGTLAMYMVGTLCCAPVLGKFLEPAIAPFFKFLGADPSMFAGMFIGSDSGAYPLAVSLTQNPAAADFSGLIVASMQGIAITFLIPYLIAVSNKESRPLIAKGILAGISTIPFGCLVGGFYAGYGFIFMIKNLIPSILFSGFVASGLFFFQSAAIKMFLAAGKIMTAFLAITLMAACVQGASGIVFIKGIVPAQEAFAIVGSIIVILVGAFVFVDILAKLLRVPLEKTGQKLKINGSSVKGLLSVLANTIAMAALINDMDDRGKVLNAAFAVSAGFALGDHLAFTAGVNRDMVAPVVIGKLTAGASALLLAILVSRPKFNIPTKFSDGDLAG